MATVLHDRLQMPAIAVAIHDNPVILASDATANDSDKTFSVPSHYRWHVWAIRVKLTTTATVGNRRIAVHFRNDSDAIFLEIPVGATQAASLVYYYSLAPGLADLTAVRGANNVLTTPIPGVLVLPQGFDIRVLDEAAVAAAADDMEVTIFGDSVDVRSFEV